MKAVNLKVKNTQIPVIFESSKALPVVYLKLIFKVAGSCEDSKKSGLANLIAKILNEGTISEGASGFAKELEMRAINMYASAGFETINIELNCLKEYFGFATKKLQELLSEPNLTDEILNKLKKLTLGEILSNENDYDYVAKSALNELLYPKTALANQITGTKESIEKINLEDIKNFLKTHLDLANLFVVFGGDVAIDELNLDHILTNLDSGKKRIQDKLKTSEKMSEKFIIKPSEQAYVYFGAPFEVDIEDRFKARVATFILGEGGFGSRLMEEIRVKRGLAYSAYARAGFAPSYSQIAGYLQTKNENKDNAIAVVKSEFERFVKKGVNSHELTQAKKFLLGSEPLRQETLLNRLNIAQNEFYNGLRLGHFKEELDKISKLKLSELNEFITAHTEITKLSFAVLYNEI
ncbi:M16 family metallopeptidase [Campylobacter sp. RM16192]|uniref:M16 family metallopeptidase n=1 Tax=Campylobacter sp. RM16192 TaxID=1660080 RepID=UPI001451600B|nr:pitrilysin family protein [Campylobacter sp. RM16192]QCD52917.1 peptidase, M16 family [Campylobacter sp. RM16192]